MMVGPTGSGKTRVCDLFFGQTRSFFRVTESRIRMRKLVWLLCSQYLLYNRLFSVLAVLWGSTKSHDITKRQDVSSGHSIWRSLYLHLESKIYHHGTAVWRVWLNDPWMVREIYTIPYHTTPHHTTPHHTTPHHTTPHHTIHPQHNIPAPYHTIPYRIMFYLGLSSLTMP